MTPFILRQNISESTFAYTLALNGVVSDQETESVAGEIYWRWEDEPEMALEYFGKAVPGNSLRVPIDLKGRDIHLVLVSQSADGRRSVANLNDGEHYVFTAPGKSFSGESVIEAGEDLTAWGLINIYDDSGTPKARHADATDDTKPAHAFVREAATISGLAPGSDVRLFYVGNIIEVSGRTPGFIQYLRAGGGDGEMVEVAPSTSGNIVQRVGIAISATEVIFNPEPPADVP